MASTDDRCNISYRQARFIVYDGELSRSCDLISSAVPNKVGLPLTTITFNTSPGSFISREDTRIFLVFFLFPPFLFATRQKTKEKIRGFGARGSPTETGQREEGRGGVPTTSGETSDPSETAKTNRNGSTGRNRTSPKN